MRTIVISNSTLTLDQLTEIIHRLTGQAIPDLEVNVSNVTLQPQLDVAVTKPLCNDDMRAVISGIAEMARRGEVSLPASHTIVGGRIRPNGPAPRAGQSKAPRR